MSLVNFPCGDISLEGVWHLPRAAGPFPAVVVCHPHPLHGGDMSNNVVVAIGEALTRKSIAAFRFNFRGAGESGGMFSGGVGEQEDVKAALALVSSAPDIDAKRVGLAGYSFGAGVALQVALRDERVNLLALVSLPADSGWEKLRRYLRPRLLIVGDADFFVPLERVQQYIKDIPEPRQYQVVTGADHFWWGHEEEMAQKVAEFFAAGFNQD